MPIPKPESGESKNEFVSRCIEHLMRKDPGRGQAQIIAICESAWEKKSKDNK